MESEYTPEQYRLAQIRNFLNCEPLCKAIGVKNIDVYLRNEMPLRMHVPIGDDGG